MSTQAQLFLMSPSLRGIVEAGLAGVLALSVRPDQILRTTGDQEGLSYLRKPAGRTHKLHPVFLLTAKEPGPGNDIRRLGPTDPQQSWAAKPFPIISALLPGRHPASWMGQGHRERSGERGRSSDGILAT